MGAFAKFSLPSPIGLWQGLADLDGARPVVLAVVLGEPGALTVRLTPEESERTIKSSRDAAGLTALLRDYFDGNPGSLSSIAVRQPGSPFRQDVWKAMRAIKPRAVRSYAELAAAAGRPAAVRAAASACASNRIPLIVPCHRVVRSGGALGNYYYGVDVKRWLLEHEGAQLAR